MSDVLPMLLAQAEGRGTDLVTLRALMEEAAEAGARRALAISARKPADARRAQATSICEQFIGQVLIARKAAETVNAGPEWQRLKTCPVRAFDNVPLDAGDYAIDIDSAGDGWIRVLRNALGPIDVEVTVGLAASAEDVPGPLRLGIERLSEWLVNHTPDESPPAAVTALWRPYRRMRLS